jgi:glucoamylase
MPLLWSHAEFLKLLIAREDRRPIELLQAVEQRYRASGGKYAARPAATWHWRTEVPVMQHETGRALLIEDRTAFTLHFGFDGFQRIEERAASAQPFGLWAVRLSAAELSGARELNFTRRYQQGWEGLDHRILLGIVDQQRALGCRG